MIRVYDVDGQKLRNPRTFTSMEMSGQTGFADGIRCDEDGNGWAGMGWVGDGTRLVMTGSTSLDALYVETRGANIGG